VIPLIKLDEKYTQQTLGYLAFHASVVPYLSYALIFFSELCSSSQYVLRLPSKTKLHTRT